MHWPYILTNQVVHYQICKDIILPFPIHTHNILPNKKLFNWKT